MMYNNDRIYWDEAYAIKGAALDVYQRLGAGMKEVVYADALEVEFGLRKIPFYREKPYQLLYKGVKLRHTFQCDFVCYDKIIVEIKAVHELDDLHKSQILNYLHYSGLHLGLLMNFCSKPFVSKRFVV